tara:strand:+ start:103 stop:333 length:231 start_codon:yes stop_codon:yes gene_type:complete
MKKEKSEALKKAINDNFSYLSSNSMNNTDIVHSQAEDKTYFTQGEFEEHAGNKKELYAFMQTQNIFIPHFDSVNTD